MAKGSSITVCLLCAVSFLFQANCAVDDKTVRYVRLGGSPAPDARPCGANLSQPCSSISAALSNNSKVRTVLLLPVDNNTVIRQTEDVNGVENVVIRALDNASVTIRLGLETDETSKAEEDFLNLFNETFLLVRNSTNVTIQHVHIDMTQSVGVGIMVWDSDGVHITDSVFTGIGKNRHGVTILNSHSTHLSRLSFKGVKPRPFAPGINESYIAAALKVWYICLEGLWPSSGCDPNEQGSLLSYDLVVENSEFKELGFLHQRRIYRRELPEGHSVGEATVAHLHIGSLAKDRKLLFRNVSMQENQSPYDPTLTILFKSGSQRNSVELEKISVNDSFGYIGGVLFVRFGEDGNNSVQLRNSVFTNNLAFLEASMARVAFEGRKGSSLDQFTVESCVFSQSYAGFVITHMPGTFVFSARFGTATRKGNVFPVVFRNCSFLNNSAQVGSVVYAQRVDLQFIDW